MIRTTIGGRNGQSRQVEIEMICEICEYLTFYLVDVMIDFLQSVLHYLVHFVSLTGYQLHS